MPWLPEPGSGAFGGQAWVWAVDNLQSRGALGIRSPADAQAVPPCGCTWSDAGFWGAGSPLGCSLGPTQSSAHG